MKLFPFFCMRNLSHFMHNTNNPWQTRQKQLVYESPWITVEHHDVLNPAGNAGTYSLVHFKRLAIGILPLDDENNTWIVGQYRYPMQCYTWEIPEGGGERSVDPLETAKRELLEECGIVASEWKLIQQLQLSNSATDEVAYLYIARGLTFTEAQPEETEQLTVCKIHFDELYARVCNGEITDSLTVAAVLKARLMMMEHEL
ncbi:MAG: NUDIX domain-containing protein [Bacteroidota bacterium]|jgi:8-oxo-dGTP pyrophosphatase MutT (NUDIX family)